MLENIDPQVFLIGGAPGAGKSTLCSALATRLDVTSPSVDDLVTAAQAVTTPETHPGLHVMRRVPSVEYFTNSPVDQLKEDATLQHEATWPLVERVVRKHVAWGPGIVIDGWHMRPSMVAQLKLDNVWSGWIVASSAVLEERERKNSGWLKDSSDPRRMLENFLARSLWYNDLIRQQASEFQMNSQVDPIIRTAVRLK